MSDTIKVFAFSAHSYEDRKNKRIYRINSGEVKEIPEDIAMYILESHPDKLRMVYNEEDYNQCLEDYLEMNPPRNDEVDSVIENPDKKVRYSPQKRKIRNGALHRSRNARKEALGDGR